MVSYTHLFVYISEVVRFVEQATKCYHEVLVKQGRAVVDGKSILGLYSLDLLCPVVVEIDPRDEHFFQSIFKEN